MSIPASAPFQKQANVTGTYTESKGNSASVSDTQVSNYEHQHFPSPCYFATHKRTS